ncbi:MAG: hypothetical protein MPL62_16475, partial [Alphaproteobacteria bacterium]|nr:hypothetical protein [Alphaproteobacteria bacterium]
MPMANSALLSSQCEQETLRSWPAGERPESIRETKEIQRRGRGIRGEEEGKEEKRRQHNTSTHDRRATLVSSRQHTTQHLHSTHNTAHLPGELLPVL